jgi:predicted RNA-binding protein with PIN domain
MPEFTMHILIDGYNLIRQSVSLKRFERQSLDAGRKALIAWLADYRKRKDHRITVVFDGWESGPAQEERDYACGISIIYSGRGVKADDVLKRITAATDEEIIVVSSDREISSYTTRRGKATLSSAEFEFIVNRQSSPSADDQIASQKDEEDEENSRPANKKGTAHRLSRAQRHAQTKIRKL